jgi:hypothetical protein
MTVTVLDFANTKEHRVAMAGRALHGAVAEIKTMMLSKDNELRDLMVEQLEDWATDYHYLGFVLSALEMKEKV